MSNCLGLYIEEQLIKYAKVSKERDNLKVETFGVMFYEKLSDAIKQIIEETYSQKTPISINLSEEMYNYFDMFSLLTKSDLQKAIKTEFELYCSDKGYNANVFETRYSIVDNHLDKDKIKVIHIAENKIELNKIIQQIDGYKLTTVSPIPMAIPNLIDAETGDNCLIVNIEDKTTITTILDKKILNVDILEEGSKNFLTKINAKENSYAKSYEVCKNTTIYTSEGKELQEEDTNYLEDIMPTLFEIVSKTKKILNDNIEKITKVYITGTGALINNIDLYFQEYISEADCEILKPYFIENIRDVSMKDYIEVNSAISLALMGVGEGLNGINFKRPSLVDSLPDWLKIEIGTPKKDKKQNKEGLFTWNLGQKLDVIETNLVRATAGILLLILVYSGLSILLDNQINRKDKEIEQSIKTTTEQIKLADSDNEKIKTKTNEYSSLIKSIEDTNDKIAERNRTRNAIPNLLNQIMSIIPANVQITSIENTTGTHIAIYAQSNKYEQLGYLVAKIKTDVILTNVVSTSGQKEDEVVVVKIEGDLP